MSGQSAKPSRRAVLTAAVGASLGALSATLARAVPAQAADGEPVLVGGSYDATSETLFNTGDEGGTALRGRSGTGSGVVGASLSGSGVMGASGGPGSGVFGVNGGDAAGVEGSSSGCGVKGISSNGPAPIQPLNTGVYGYAGPDANARGVHGQVTAGRGVFGQATTGQGIRGATTSGTAVYAASSDPMVGYAIRAIGRVRLDQCAGVASIDSGDNKVIVVPGIDLVSTSAVVATLQGNPGGRTTVQRVSVSATTNAFTIFLTATSTTAVKVAWHVFG